MQVLLYTVPDAAKLMGLAEVTLKKWIYARKIESVLLGRSRRIHINAINRFIEENTIPSLN